MSIQDHIFDVQEAVKGTDVEDSFNLLMSWAAGMEVDIERIQKENIILRSAIRLVK